MTTFSVYRRATNLVDLLIPDTMDSTGTELAQSYTLSVAPNWDGVFAPVATLTPIIRGYGRTTLSVSNSEKDIAGGSAVLRGKTRVLARFSDLGWNDNDVIFVRVTASFPTLPDETGPILLILTADQYRLSNASLVLSGVAGGEEIQLPRVCSEIVVNVTAGTLLLQLGTGPSIITIPSTNVYAQPSSQFSALTVDGGATFSIALTLNVRR